MSNSDLIRNAFRLRKQRPQWRPISIEPTTSLLPALTTIALTVKRISNCAGTTPKNPPPNGIEKLFEKGDEAFTPDFTVCFWLNRAMLGSAIVNYSLMSLMLLGLSGAGSLPDFWATVNQRCSKGRSILTSFPNLNV
jgi:hypothetical protein